MKPEEHIPLSAHTTFKLGGPARYFFRIHTVDEAKEALRFAHEQKIPFFALGGGSNVLVSDEGFRGVVIKNDIHGIIFLENEQGTLVTAGAGEKWDTLVALCVERGLHNIENLSGIPGTVGGAVVQNIGAYGVEVNTAVVSVEAIDGRDGSVRTFTGEECRFSYRDSFFKTEEGKSFLITNVTFQLQKSGEPNLRYKDLKNFFSEKATPPNLAEVRSAVLEIRKGKFPDLSTTGTAGSFFKNPIISQQQLEELRKKYPKLPVFPVPGSESVKISLAWILDNVLHLKGFMEHNVGLYEAQPLVVVHTGGSTSEAVRHMAEGVARKVKEITGITLEWEVETL